MHSLSRRAPVAALLAFLLLPCHTAEAAVLTIPFGREYTSGSIPSGSGPWLLAAFDDHGESGSVTLTVTANLSAPSEFVSRAMFNLDPSMDPGQLVFSAPAKSGTFGDPVVGAGADAFSSGGGVRFDLQLLFDNSPPSNRFGGSDSVTYTISGIAGLTAGSFSFGSTGGGSGGASLPASAHVQGVGTNGGSAWVTSVPEPAVAGPLALVAAALIKRCRAA